MPDIIAVLGEGAHPDVLRLQLDLSCINLYAEEKG
jgi:hypothetical protein